MKRIVVADDNEILLKQIVDYLTLSNEIEIVGAVKDGEAELESIKSTKPDIVITDIEMPKKTGVDVIELVESSFENPPKFIIITGGASSEVMQRLYKLAVKRIFYKPLDMQELVKEILQEEEERKMLDNSTTIKRKCNKKENLWKKVFFSKNL